MPAAPPCSTMSILSDVLLLRVFRGVTPWRHHDAHHRSGYPVGYPRAVAQRRYDCRSWSYKQHNVAASVMSWRCRSGTRRCD